MRLYRQTLTEKFVYAWILGERPQAEIGVAEQGTAHADQIVFRPFCVIGHASKITLQLSLVLSQGVCGIDRGRAEKRPIRKRVHWLVVGEWIAPNKESE